MIETKVRGPELAPLDDPPEDRLPEPVALTPEQIAAQAEAEERDRKRRLEWDAINKALRNNSMAVTRAIARWHPRDGEGENYVERVLANFEDGSFLINRLGAAGVVDQDLAIVLLDLRRRLIDDYGETPAAMMLIDRAVAAYQDFIRVEGWIGNLAIMIENEFFGVKGPSANYQDRWGREGPTIRGLTVEQHLRRLREELLPLAERCGRTMCGALAALETLRALPSQAVERSKPIKVSVIFDLRERGNLNS